MFGGSDIAAPDRMALVAMQDLTALRLAMGIVQYTSLMPFKFGAAPRGQHHDGHHHSFFHAPLPCFALIDYRLDHGALCACAVAVVILPRHRYNQKQSSFVRDTSLSKINRLEIKQLRLFQALLRERNVSRVASQIGLTQQAVSDQLKKLRDIFDDPLFLRKSNGLVPTPAAESLGTKVDTLLGDFERLLAPAAFDPAEASVTFTIAASDYAQQVVLPALLNQLRRQAPGIRLIIRDLDIDTLGDLMPTGKINLAISCPEHLPARYPSQFLFKEHHVCVASMHSPLAGRPLALADVAEVPQIIASPSRPNFRGSVDACFEQAGLHRQVVISAPCFSVVPLYLDTTDTIAFLPSRAVTGEKLTVLDLDEQLAEFDVVAAWHPRSNRDPLHNWICELLHQLYPD